jgi:hypothetical protein
MWGVERSVYVRSLKRQCSAVLKLKLKERWREKSRSRLTSVQVQMVVKLDEEELGRLQLEQA